MQLEAFTLKGLKEIFVCLQGHGHFPRFKGYLLCKFDVCVLLRNSGLIDEAAACVLMVRVGDDWETFRPNHRRRFYKGEKVVGMRVLKKPVTVSFGLL